MPFCPRYYQEQPWENTLEKWTPILFGVGVLSFFQPYKGLINWRSRLLDFRS